MSTASLPRLRLWAWLLDALLFLGVGACFGRAGWLASAAYWLCRDGLFQGQSIGKRLVGLRVVTGKGRGRCTVRLSAIRNVLWIIPFVNVLMGLTGLYLLARDPAGRHWGDRLADTRVVSA